MIEMAAETGLCEFVDRDSSLLKIKVMGEVEEYRNIKFYDFTSARKMMSRVVQNVKTGQVLVLTKGADSAILSRTIARNYASNVRNQGCLERFNSEERAIVNDIEDFAAQGFRTLMFAMKELDSPEVDGVLT